MYFKSANDLATAESQPRDCELETRLRKRILAALRTAGYPELWSVRCHVSEDAVVLSGVLPSYHLKQVAQHAILVLNDPRVVKNLIEVSS
ncbi:MAG TPA: hypothetical protein VMV10_08305 [Pirellulales bacterium]|nr:hypothetical protein [Pirellulales bacterium]